MLGLDDAELDVSVDSEGLTVFLKYISFASNSSQL